MPQSSDSRAREFSLACHLQFETNRGLIEMNATRTQKGNCVKETNNYTALLYVKD